MHVLYVLSFIACFFQLAPLCAEQAPKVVLVSVAPHKHFVEKIGGPLVHVELMVPAGASAHTYEPSPRQMMKVHRADVWFTVGEAFEKKAANALKSYHPELKIADLRQGLDLIRESCCRHHQQEGAEDLHFWLSPHLALIQAKTILEGLSEVYPNYTKEFEQNYQKFCQQLRVLDQEIKTILSQPHNPYVMISHPAYAYFCRDYHCHQLSIEFEGKDPTPQQLTKILNLAKLHHIKTIFVQPQYSSKGAKLIAQSIGAKVVVLDPYSEDYFRSLKEIAEQFSQQPIDPS